MDTVSGMLQSASLYNSPLFKKVRATGRLAIFDLDGTCTGDPEAKKQLRALAEQKQYAEVFGSARTFELMVSEDVRQMSVGEHSPLHRPQPKCGLREGKRTYQPLEDVPLFQNLLNPDAVISFGIGNFIRLKDGTYVLDEEYDRLLGLRHWGNDWRTITTIFLEKIDPDGKFRKALVPLDQDGAYEKGIVDVAPLPYRIGFEFSGPEGFELKCELKERVLQAVMAGRYFHNGRMIPGSHIAAGLAVVDESHPEKGRYMSYLLPRNGTKEKAYNRLLKQTLLLSGKRNSEVELFIAGDTMTDFRAGCYVGWTQKGPAVKGTFLLAGGSRLSEYLVGRKKGERFAGELLDWEIKRFERAEKANHPGVYYFRAPWSGSEFRRIIIADEAFPGTREVESVLAYFESPLCLW